MPTTSTNLSEAQRSRLVARFMAGYSRESRIASAIAWREEGALNVPFDFTRWNEADTSGIAAQAAEAGSAAEIVMSDDSAQATPQVYFFEVRPTDQAMRGADPVLGVPTSMLMEATNGLLEIVERNLMAVTAGATNFTGAVTDDMTETIALDAITTFRAQTPRVGLGAAMVLGNIPAGIIRRSALLNSQASAKVGDDFAKGSIASNRMGTFGGVEVWESTLVAAQGAGLSNFITALGHEYSGLGLVVAPGPDGSEIQFTRSYGSPEATTATVSLVFRLDHGVVETNPQQMIELRSAA